MEKRILNKEGKLQCYHCKQWLSLKSFTTNGYLSYDKNSICKKCDHLRYLKMREVRLAYWKKSYHIRRLKKHKLLVSEYDDMLKNQKGVCAICGEEFTRTPYIDHDHITGRVRGLLCRDCNGGLGFFKDKCENLKKAIEYLGE